MNREEFAKKIGLNPETVRKYETDFNIPISRDKNNYRVYTDLEIEVYETIKELKDEHSIKSIQRIIKKNTGCIHEDAAPVIQVVEPEIVEMPGNTKDETTGLYTALDELKNSLVSRLDDNQDTLMQMTKQYVEMNIKAAEEKLKLIESHNAEKIEFIEKSHEKDLSIINKELERKEIEIRELTDKLEKERLEKHSLKEMILAEKSKGIIQKFIEKFKS